MQMFFLPQKLGGFLCVFSGIKPWLTRSITRSRPSSWQRPLDQPTPRELPPLGAVFFRCLLKNLRQTAPRFEDVEAEMLTTYLWDSSRYNLLINCIMNLLLTYNMKQASEQVYDLYSIYIHFTDHVYLCQNTFRDQEC